MKRLFKRLKMFWNLAARLSGQDYYIINAWKKGRGWVISYYYLPEGKPDEAQRLIMKGYEAVMLFIGKLIILKKLREEGRN